MHKCVREEGHGIRKDLELGLFQGSPKAQPRYMHKAVAGLAKSLARRPGAIVFSSRATKMYQRPARRATLNTGLPRNVPSKLRALGRTLLQPRPRRRNNVPLARTQKLVGKVI